ncbi:hypothetical protein ACFUJ0_33125 [Streptomyces sp. NPDC057242]|uniref:hypothetical protein n=1 Tax=Streptomyces sp. NPDC057242 TaxID=3346063 RepID=UPI00362956F0
MGLAGLEADAAEPSTPTRVYVPTGRLAGPGPVLPEPTVRIRTPLAEVTEDGAWRRFPPGYVPPTESRIRAAPEPPEARGAAPFLTGLATVDPVRPGHRRLPEGTAGRAADRVVFLLGPEASRWTDHDAERGAVNGLTPLSDSLLAGTDGERFVPAPRIADDRAPAPSVASSFVRGDPVDRRVSWGGGARGGGGAAAPARAPPPPPGA